MSQKLMKKFTKDHNQWGTFHRFQRYLVISPMSDFANVMFANVLGRFAKAKSPTGHVLLVTLLMY